jgi:hypothetical protein
MRESDVNRIAALLGFGLWVLGILLVMDIAYLIAVTGFLR